MEDPEYLALLKERPDQGMEALMDRYGGLVWAVVRNKLHRAYFDDADVEDCVAEVFGGFYLALEGFDPTKSSIRTYLTLMARRKAVDLLRKRHRRGIPIPLDGESEPELAPIGEGPEEMLTGREERERLISAIRSLGEPDATILLGKYYFERSTRDLAKALNMSAGAVDTRAHRAMKRLKRMIKGEEP